VRICVIGKFPPIQGGVSMRTYWAAHALAKRGHEVHVVTNAKEARPPFRMHMRPPDWARCEARYDPGSVMVHWTDPVDRSQSYIPMASPFVSKLATIAARAHSERPFDVIYSHYLEPYGVAGHLAAQITGVPHVARMAGSDAGRLWRHPQFELLYDHVLRSAELVIATGPVAKRAIERRIDPARIVFGGGIVVPDDVFTPDGPALDLKQLRREVAADPELRDLLWGDFAGGKPYFGICGKLGDSKGSFPLLAAMHRLKRAGLDVALVALAQGHPVLQKEFRARARKLGLTDRILQLPFLPHWRVPELLRGCLAVCCLEQDFPIVFHTPIIPREVLLCGACLVGSTEVIRKLPGHGQLVHGYGCVAIEDVNDVEALSARLAAIVRDPKPAAAVGTRGRRFARELQQEMPFAQMLERTLEAAASRQPIPAMTQASESDLPAEPREDRFPLTRLAEIAIGEATGNRSAGDAAAASPAIDLARAREVLAAARRRVADGEAKLAPFVPAVEIEIAIAAVENDTEQAPAEASDPLFRLHLRRWAMAEGDLAALVPQRDPRLRVIEFDYDVADFMGARTIADLPTSPAPRRSYIVAFSSADGEGRNPLMVDRTTAQILMLSDGTRTASEIARELDRQAGGATDSTSLAWIEGLLVHGLISLHDKRSQRVARVSPVRIDATRGSKPSPVPRPRTQRKVNRRSLARLR
jgi:glycosyltransferase involved in cell wall biosynthesis